MHIKHFNTFVAQQLTFKTTTKRNPLRHEVASNKVVSILNISQDYLWSETPPIVQFNVHLSDSTYQALRLLFITAQTVV